MNILVTGGAGFIGSHIVRKLIELNHKPIVLDNFISGKKENLADLDGRITIVEGDIRNTELIESLLGKGDIVFHEAALASVQWSVDDPMETSDVNITGTINLLDIARRKGVKRFVFASSSSVYGNNTTEVQSERLVPDPLSPYAVSKLASESMCKAFHEVYRLPTVALRYFNVFGPRQDETSQYSAVIPAFITRMLAGKQPIVYGDGLQTRDFVFVGDVANANLLAAGLLDGGATDIAFGKSVNIATNQNYSLLHLIDIINKELKTNIQPVFDKPRLGEAHDSLADISRAEKLIGYRPQVSFEEGIKQTIQWYRKKFNL